MQIQKVVKHDRSNLDDEWFDKDLKDFGIGLEVNSKLYSQGQMLIEAPVPVKMTAEELKKDAELLGLPQADYAVYLKTEKGNVFVPSDKTIEQAAKEEGIALTEDTTLELALEPEFKGA
jgi:hypothetical protein